MLIVPAIDIMGGRVVRLEQGDFDKAIYYDRTPLAYAQLWQMQGARFLHVVDLDGARYGVPKNFKLVRDIARSTGVKVEVGGGIRSIETIRKYLDIGIDRVVLSTKILEDASFLLSRDIQKYLNRVAVSIDVKHMEMSESVTTATGGWLQSGDMTIDLATFVQAIVRAGIGYINFSDISKDGMLSGPDTVKISRFLEMARQAGGDTMFFTYAGGISSLEDIRRLKSLGAAGVDAVIVGRALYENKFDVSQAIEASR
ncbi:MAG: HisA/HisF-related TIM barrel protein [Candidatus Omnitrophica bacterium]|nr:HisA/HisF-related TIM barrel protein [Candidatus Omnitrophota bacterium]MDD5573925.1 HisA/HisF-related TIM barrel protein [Candidatus Omnitrophota bacterium]